ncbi:MAG: hypothetical protein KFF72_20285, partial [Arthrospira sp. SH-MAG29]
MHAPTEIMEYRRAKIVENAIDYGLVVGFRWGFTQPTGWLLGSAGASPNLRVGCWVPLGLHPTY